MPATAPDSIAAALTMLSGSVADNGTTIELPCWAEALAGQLARIGCDTGSPQVCGGELLRRGPATGAALKSAALLSVSVQPSAARWIELPVDGAGATAVS